MQAVVKAFDKSSIEKRRLVIDYSCWLADGETLVNFGVIVQPFTEEAPLGAFAAYSNIDNVANTGLTLFLTGGLRGQTYRVALVVDTNQGQTKRDDIAMRVR